MIVDGETLACETCVRGHRAKNCQHHDRPLQSINKKGRPVSQCQHCRVMRKSRAAHVKCTCGKKFNEFTQQKEAMNGDKETCFCHHGGRCTCAHKKAQPEPDIVPAALYGKSNNSTKPKSDGLKTTTSSSSGFPTSDENTCHNSASKNVDWTLIREDEPSYKRSPHNMNSVSNGSTNKSTNTDSTGARSGNSAVPQSQAHPEQSRGPLGIATPVLNSNNPPFSHLQFGTQQPLFDMFNVEYSANTHLGWSGGLPDATQTMFGADPTANSIDWFDCELDALSGSDQAKNFEGSNSDWLGFPMVPDIHGMELPEIGDFFDPPAQVLEHRTSLPLLDPTVPGGLNAKGCFFDTEHLDNQPNSGNGQDGST